MFSFFVFMPHLFLIPLLDNLVHQGVVPMSHRSLFTERRVRWRYGKFLDFLETTEYVDFLLFGQALAQFCREDTSYGMYPILEAFSK